MAVEENDGKSRDRWRWAWESYKPLSDSGFYSKSNHSLLKCFKGWPDLINSLFLSHSYWSLEWNLKENCMEGTETRQVSLPSSRQDMGNNPIHETETKQYFWIQSVEWAK